MPVFKIVKNNFPKNYSSPNDLKVFISSIKSELTDPLNRNSETSNIPVEKINALNQLIQLQKERQIVIKACDKGAGVMILDFKNYMKSCYNHLLSKNRSEQSYYSKVEDFEIEGTKVIIRNTLKEGLDRKILSREEYNAMNPDDKTPGRFYCNFKVHKKHEHKEAPPVRPIVNGSGSITEGIATYVEYHIKYISKKHDTYLEDTPDFLRHINIINKGPTLSNKALFSYIGC